MKIVLILLLTAFSLIASTHYKTPNMVVGSEPMYCTDYYGEQLAVHSKGDIIEGDYANRYCSFNKSTVKQKMSYLSSIHDHKQDSLIQSVLKWFLIALVIFLLYMLSKLFKPEKDNN